MLFINEQHLDDAVESIHDDESLHELLVTELSEVQPAVFAFLFTENTELFTEYEKEYLLFILLCFGLASTNVARKSQMPRMSNKRMPL